MSPDITVCTLCTVVLLLCIANKHTLEQLNGIAPNKSIITTEETIDNILLQQSQPANSRSFDESSIHLNMQQSVSSNRCQTKLIIDNERRRIRNEIHA